MAISMLKIRRPLGRLIFNMGIATPGKTVFLIEMAPRRPQTELQPKSTNIKLQMKNKKVKQASDPLTVVKK